MYSDCTGSAGWFGGCFRMGLYEPSHRQWYLRFSMKLAIIFGVLVILAPVSAAFSQVSTNKVSGSDRHDFYDLYRLSVKPETCVALHKGQRCFTQVVLSWSVPDNQQYCLFNTAEDTALHCSTANRVTFTIDYASDTSTLFELRQGSDGQPVASATVSTAWVYRTGRRSSSSWRLF